MIFIKENFVSSTITNFTYNKLHEKTKMHPNTLRKYIKILQEMGFIKKVGKNNQHLIFMPIKAKKLNVDIGNIDYSDIKTIELGLLAMFLVEKQRQKEFIKDLLQKKETIRKGAKKIVKVCNKYGYKDFSDDGISYKYIASRLNISINKVSSLIKEAINRGLLIKEKHSEQISLFLNKNAKKAYEYLYKFIHNSFSTNNNIYIVHANTYKIVGRHVDGNILDY